MVDLIGGQEISAITSFENTWFIPYPKWIDQKSYQNAKDMILNYQILKQYIIDNIDVVYLGRK